MTAGIRSYLRIDGQHIRELAARAEATSAECCGFLLGHDRGSRVIKAIIPATNIADDKTRYFKVDPLEYLQAEQYADSHGLELLGIYHSHPNGTAIPSETDRLEAQPYFSYVILAVTDRRFGHARSWRLNHARQFEEEILLR